jgi:hypothetical protein
VVHEGESEPWATGRGDVTFADGPLFLDAGQTRRIALLPDIASWGIHADFPMRVYATDIRHRRVWGNAAPVIRMLLGDEPPLQAGDPGALRRISSPVGRTSARGPAL